MNTRTEERVAAVLARLTQLLRELDTVSPSRFPALIAQAGEIGEWYAGVLALDYAANSKELRDTDDEAVHSVCLQIRPAVDALAPFFRARLFPRSLEQAQRWRAMAAPESDARFAFRSDDSIEIGLLDSTLSGDQLRVRRVWSHVGNFDGFRIALDIGLDELQATEMQERFANARIAWQTIMEARAAADCAGRRPE